MLYIINNMKVKNKKRINKKGIDISVGRIFNDGSNSTTNNGLILPAGYAHGEYRPTDAEGNARFIENTENRSGAVWSDEFGAYILPKVEVTAEQVVTNNPEPVVQETTINTEVPAVEPVQPVDQTTGIEPPVADNNNAPTEQPTDGIIPEESTGKNSNFNLGNTINGIMGTVNSGIQAYNNVSPMKSADTSSAIQLGNSNYQMGSLQNLANQYANRNIPQSITGKDLYNPSAGERFSQMFSSGLSGFQAGYNASANSGLTSNMGEFSFKKANGGPLHKYAFGGGATVDAAVGLGVAGINMGLNAAKNASNRKQAALEAQRFNALKEFSVDRNNLDFQRVLNDSTDNMFNMTALQMKAMGGPLSSYGADWTTGLNVVGNGGTHEQNPFEGVPMGIAPDGIPNLVEENETVWTDDEGNSYVFSERLKVSKKMLDKHMLPSKYEGKSYAEVSKELSKESEERPNDPISKRGLEDNMAKLQQAQEEYKAIKDQEKLKKALDKLTPEEQEMLLAQNTEGIPQQVFNKGGMLIRKWDEADGDVEKSKKAEKWLETLEALPSTLMRYTPTLIQGIQALKGNKVDYTNPNLIAANTRNINFTPLGDYMALERLPFVSTIGNKMQAQQAATNAAIQNVAANRSAAIPSLLTSGYKGQTALADAALEAAKYNNLLAQTEAEFNRGTNQANLTAGLQTASANQQTALDSAYKQAAMRELIDQYISESNSTNATTLLDNIQNIGREMDAIREAKKTMAANAAYGGKLNKRKKKGLTC